jgi:hypothetical protein
MQANPLELARSAQRTPSNAAAAVSHYVGEPAAPIATRSVSGRAPARYRSRP